MLFSRRKINDDNGPVCGDGPLEIPKQTYLVESVVIGFALVGFRFVMAGGFININLLKWESNTESHEIGTTTVTVSVAGSARCGAVQCFSKARSNALASLFLRQSGTRPVRVEPMSPCLKTYSAKK